MKNLLLKLSRPLSLIAAVIAASLMTIGCSLFDPPTASNDVADATVDLWAPEPGDEIVPGRPIPVIMDENYWETPGTVNPSLRGLTGVTRVIINGAFGGTVTCGLHNYVVPSGAVSGLITFTMSLASTNGIAVDCGPSPLSFNSGAPVRITLSYAGTQYDPDYCAQRGIEPLDASELEIFHMSQDGDFEQQDDDREFNPSTKTISVEVSHFSRYIVA